MTAAAQPIANQHIAVLFRPCAGCGQSVHLDEWQEGPLGCDECRRAARPQQAAADPITPAND